MYFVVFYLISFLVLIKTETYTAALLQTAVNAIVKTGVKIDLQWQQSMASYAVSVTISCRRQGHR